MERIQKVISNYGYASRREAEKLILEKRVKVNGEVVTELGTKVSTSDTISIDDIDIDKNIKYEYYLLYKPREVITSTKDEVGRKTVVDLINTNTRIYPVGRLDYDTTGLLLLTNDGTLANILMHPSSNVDKVYVAKVKGLVKKEDISCLKRGVLIDNYLAKATFAKVRKYDKKSNTSIAEIVIHEGKNHQVKKMFNALSYDVVKLKRERYAFLNLEGLKPGEYRKLQIKEVKKLYSLKKH